MAEQRRRWLGYCLIALAGVVAACGAVAGTRHRPKVVQSSIQCGHWCVLRCCEILGLPTDVAAVQGLLDYHPDGHSMAELAQVLDRLGIETEGRLESIGELGHGPLPAIAHLTEPDHFVVVVSVDQDYVHIFDGGGQRKARAVEDFRQRWSGNVLHVTNKRGHDVVAGADGPRIELETLHVDKGIVPVQGGAVPFDFGFQNAGTRDLRILAIQTTCGCPVEGPRRPIPPGGEATLTMHYRPPKQGGPFTHYVTVKTNDPQRSLIRIRASGFADVGVEVMPSTIAFGRVAVGTPRVVHCFVRYAGERKSLVIESVKSSPPEVADVTWRQFENDDPEWLRRSLPAKREGVQIERPVRIIEVSFSPRPGAPAHLQGTIDINTSAKGFEKLSVPFIASIAPD
jgi:predicted double-glycine peptidase